ncbi:hypothetical protein HanIR_Chr11g0553151 [Helianthus annuus]|nr:hypothetical protein HanIR_Chr11g0553151 [Helianthus annuus]
MQSLQRKSGVADVGSRYFEVCFGVPHEKRYFEVCFGGGWVVVVGLVVGGWGGDEDVTGGWQQS